MPFEPKVLGKYEGDDIVLFKDDEHGYCIRHDNKIYVLPYWCLGKDTSIYCARNVIRKASEPPPDALHVKDIYCEITVFSTENNI
jgi:hypothetical protein